MTTEDKPIRLGEGLILISHARPEEAGERAMMYAGTTQPTMTQANGEIMWEKGICGLKRDHPAVRTGLGEPRRMQWTTKSEIGRSREKKMEDSKGLTKT